MDIVHPTRFNRGIVLYVIGEALDPVEVTRVVGRQPDVASEPRQEPDRSGDRGVEVRVSAGFWGYRVGGEPTDPIDAIVDRAIKWIAIHHDAVTRVCMECRFWLVFPYPGPQPSDLVMDYQELLDRYRIELKSFVER